MSAASLVRPFAWAIAVVLFVAGLLQLGLTLNVFAQPPNLPSSNDLVQNLIGSLDFRSAIAPFIIAASILSAAGLLLLALFGRLVVNAAGALDDVRAQVGSWALAIGGVIGGGATLLQAGALQQAVQIPYCDCGYKAQESISQMWALNLINGGTNLATNIALLVLIAGIALVAIGLLARGMPDGWGWLSWAIVVVGLLSLAATLVPGADTVGNLLGLLDSAVLVPAWALWLGRQMGGHRAAAELAIP